MVKTACAALLGLLLNTSVLHCCSFLFQSARCGCFLHLYGCENSLCRTTHAPNALFEHICVWLWLSLYALCFHLMFTVNPYNLCVRSWTHIARLSLSCVHLSVSSWPSHPGCDRDRAVWALTDRSCLHQAHSLPLSDNVYWFVAETQFDGDGGGRREEEMLRGWVEAECIFVIVTAWLVLLEKDSGNGTYFVLIWAPFSPFMWSNKICLI